MSKTTLYSQRTLTIVHWRPRLKIADGVWICKIPRDAARHVGLGATPSKAYADWVIQLLWSA